MNIPSLKNPITNGLRHLLFPQLCPGCGSDLMYSYDHICHNCRSLLPYTNFENIPGNMTEKAFYGRVKIEDATSLLYFTKGSIVQNMLHKIKYRGGIELAVFFGRMMGKSIEDAKRWDQLDAIIPLPLHKRKEKLRGYNQAKLLAEGIGTILSIPVLGNAIKRNINSETQTRKHRQERWVNVENIFNVSESSDIEGKHILLVDDVLTTGASLEACASAILNEVNSAKISIATLAIA